MTKKYYQEHKEKIIKKTKIRYNIKRKELLLKMKIYREKNKDKISKQRKEHYKKIRKQKLLKDKIYYQKNKKRILKVCEQYRDSHKQQLSKYFKKHYQIIKKEINDYLIKRRKTDINFRLICALRIRLWKVLKGNPKLFTAMKLVGCSIDKLKQHLEK